MSMRALTAALMLGLGATPAAAQLDWRGDIELEGRYFDLEQDDGLTGSVAGRLELFQPLADPDLSFTAELFYRRDADDHRRSHGDVRQAFVRAVEGDLELNVGYRRVFWGVTEARSLVDIINQRDLVEDIDGEARLGQPMLQLRWLPRAGDGDLFILPMARKRTFPGPDGHPRVPFPIDQEASRFPAGQYRLDYAARWQWRLRDLDLAVSWFDGTARSPDFLPCLAQGSGFPDTGDGPNCNLEDAEPQLGPVSGALLNVLQLLRLAPSDQELEEQVVAEVMDNLMLIPEYPRERRAGIELQHIRGGLALRLEALARRRGGDWSLASVAGFEYTLPRFFDTGWSVGLLAEHLFDERDEDVIAQRFSNDLFFGTRVQLNDLADTLILAGAIVEPDFGNRLFAVEASRRFGQSWRVTLDVRVFDDLPEDPLVDLLDGQNRVRLQIQRFF